jgi:hypothetical protein
MYLYEESMSVKFTRRFSTEHAGKMQVVLLNAAVNNEYFNVKNRLIPVQFGCKQI